MAVGLPHVLRLLRNTSLPRIGLIQTKCAKLNTNVTTMRTTTQILYLSTDVGQAKADTMCGKKTS